MRGGDRREPRHGGLPSGEVCGEAACLDPDVEFGTDPGAAGLAHPATKVRISGKYLDRRHQRFGIARGTSWPKMPYSTSSPLPVTVVAITGRRAAIASISITGAPSAKDSSTTTCAAKRISATSAWLS